MRRLQLLAFTLVVLSFVVALAFYPTMPDYLASHWNAQGTVNGYMPKACGLLLLPVMSLVIFLLFLFFARADPLNKNISKFIHHYDLMLAVTSAFMLYMLGLMIAWNLGYRFDFIVMFTPALSVLFYFAGVVIEKTKRNYTIGIRTPWTLQSDHVWDQTHSVGGRLFKVAAVISLFGVFLPKIAIWLILIPILFVVVFVVFYSYHIYKKLEKKHVLHKK
ncbi:SdpI family protein [Candidatus Woesearchaeota archaeon]|nr:SdpI family protein [Candidatus Woesearchaeota archaeon]